MHKDELIKAVSTNNLRRLKEVFRWLNLGYKPLNKDTSADIAAVLIKASTMLERGSLSDSSAKEIIARVGPVIPMAKVADILENTGKGDPAAIEATSNATDILMEYYEDQIIPRSLLFSYMALAITT